MKIVINRCYSEFSLSDAVMEELNLPNKGNNRNHVNNKTFDIDSDNYQQYRAYAPLIKAIEKIGYPHCNGRFANLTIIELPDNVDWEIQEYDGLEIIHEILKANMKIVINCRYGGFSVSDAVMKELKLPYTGDNWNFLRNTTFGITSDNLNQYRTHTPLIEAIEKIGYPHCNGTLANLKIIEIPNNVNWKIQEYDGLETVVETIPIALRNWP